LKLNFEKKTEKGIILCLPTRKKLSNIRAVSRLGDSFAVLLPKLWVEVFCDQVDGHYRICRTIDKDVITIRPVEENDDSY